MCVEITDASKLQRKYVETWVFIAVSGQWPLRENNRGSTYLTHASRPLKIESCHDANFVPNGGTESCNDNNFWFYQWRQSWCYGNVPFLVTHVTIATAQLTRRIN